jgi:hypothetical protein
MWGRLLTCAPIANRRKWRGLANRAQDDILPHYQKLFSAILAC